MVPGAEKWFIMNRVFTVSEVNNYIKNMFQRDYMLANIYMKGEVSNCKYHTSGHIYFKLKDESGQMSCVMFAGHRAGLNFRLQDGMGITVLGSISVYERDGSYQMYAKEIMLCGQGILHERFEQLKAALLEEGLFDREHKKEIPRFPSRIGIVTASTGAAIRDIVNISSRRNPYVQLILCPALVQGEHAPQSIVCGIRRLEKLGVDTIIVGRGGGSIEDLWAFNEEAVARAIYECSVPIISAVGHETDVTIADFTADMRAPTPSAAAELAVNDVQSLLAALVDMRYDLYKGMTSVIAQKRAHLGQIKLRLMLESPRNRLNQERQLCADLEGRLKLGIERILQQKRHQLEIYAERMRGLSPLDKLKSGYAFVSDSEKPVTSVDDVSEGDIIRVNVSDGEIGAAVVYTTRVEY